MGKPVAVKFLHDSFAGEKELVKRFAHEVMALSRITHPHVVTIVDSGVAGGVPYLVMDFLSGTALGKLLDRGALPAARAVRIAQQVLAGVSEAHANGVVHRDLKPDNILLLDGVDGDFIKVLDFGLARMVDGATRITQTGLALGTPHYMAPEQALGTPIDERTDLYAIGVVLYQMVTGRKPFVAESPMAVLRMHLDEAPVPPRRIPAARRISAALEAAILRALEKVPGRRWPTAAAFSAALDAVPEAAAGATPEAMPETMPDGLATTVALVDVQREAIGRRDRGEPAPAQVRRAPARRRPSGTLRLALLALLVGSASFGWTRLSRREQQKLRHHVETAVDTAGERLRTLAPQEDSPRAPATASTATAHPGSPRASTDDDDEPDAPAPTRDTPGHRLEADANAADRARGAPPRKSPRLAGVAQLLAKGQVDDAVSALYQLRRARPRSAGVALLLGHAYFRKVWRSDGLREYESALAWRPSLRGDPLLVRNTVVALDDPTFKPARALIRNRLRAAALRELRRVARDAGAGKAQGRAARLAAEVARKARR